MDNVTNFQDQKTKPPNDDDDEEEESPEEFEALSLCDFPLNSDDPDKRDSFVKTTHDNNKRRSSSEPSEFFEFFNNDVVISDQMSDAEDIIFRGKLVPYKYKPNRLHQHIILKSRSADDQYAATHDNNLSRRYFELNPTKDCKKFRRNSAPSMKSEPSDIHRSSSKSSAKSEGSSSKASKPRWFVLMFGTLKLHQQEMDLRDMKNRQVRRNRRNMFAGIDAGDKIPARRSDRRSSWGHDWLRVLSCKNHASVAVMASSIGVVPHF